MARKRYSPEEIIQLLREVEIHTSQGKKVAQAVKQQGIAEQTYYRWRREYGGMDKSEVRRLKEVKCENARLKKLVVELALTLLVINRNASADVWARMCRPPAIRNAINAATRYHPTKIVFHLPAFWLLMIPHQFLETAAVSGFAPISVKDKPDTGSWRAPIRHRYPTTGCKR